MSEFSKAAMTQSLSKLDLPAAKETGQDTFRIAELAEEFDVTARTIRFYEDQNLITPIREGQSRIYSKRDRARLAWILRGKRVGFSLADIKDMIDLYDEDDGRAKQRAVTLAKCRQRVADLQSQRADIDATIKELQTFCTTLENLVEEGADTSATKPWDPAND